VRPAALLSVDKDVGDSYLAFAIDRAVWAFGTNVEHDMNEAENDPRLKNAKAEQLTQARRAVWEAYCYPDGTPDAERKVAPPPGRFADPMARIQAGETGR